MNLPNRLTLLRVVLVPVSMIFLLFPIGGAFWARIIAAAVFGITSFTDMLDGKIARKYGLITNFGKFMDPLADKFMVFGVLVSMCASDMYAPEAYPFFRPLLVFVTVIVIFRELAVTSMRLLAASSSDSIVIAANWAGKVKTVSQIIFILCMILEPCAAELIGIPNYSVLSFASMAFMTFMTVYSGINYLFAYRKYIDFTH